MAQVLPLSQCQFIAVNEYSQKQHKPTSVPHMARAYTKGIVAIQASALVPFHTTEANITDFSLHAQWMLFEATSGHLTT